MLREGDDPSQGDLELIKNLTGHPPTSIQLHAICDQWDSCICQELATTNAEAVELRTLSVQAMLGSRARRLLR